MRQFIIDSVPDSKGLIYISGKDYKYFRQVLRLAVGDMIKVSTTAKNVGKNKKSFDTTLCKIDEQNKKIVLQVCDLTVIQNEENFKNFEEENSTKNSSIKNENFLHSAIDFYLLQFIPKPQKMELIIRQAVECGVSKIIPVIGEFTQKGSEKSLLQKQNEKGASNSQNRQDRISRIIKEARQQSGSQIETEILEPCTLENALKIVEEKVLEQKSLNKKSVKISLYEKNEDSKTIHSVVKTALNFDCDRDVDQNEVVDQTLDLDKSEGVDKNGSHSTSTKIGFAIIAVGSEGGISPAEISVLKNHGFETVHFKTPILRCETASLYGMASLQTTIFDLDSTNVDFLLEN